MVQMKKRALKKDFYMEIKRSLGRFFSIFFIVALGVSFFAGIRASEPDMRLSGDAYFDEHHLADMKVISTMGLTENDVAALADVEGVQNVEHGYSVDAMCRTGDTKKVVHVMSNPQSLNRVVVEQGRMPEEENECFLDIDFLKSSGYQVGDEIALESGSDDPLTDSLRYEKYEIVGAGSSPCYISFERGSSMIGTGEISGFMIVPEDAFSMEVYTEVYMTVDGAFDEVAFTKQYNSRVGKAVENVESIQKVREQARREEIVEEAEKEIRDAEQELADAKKELSDGRKEYEDGKRALEEGEKQLEDGKRELVAAKKETESQLASAKRKLEDGETALISGKKELESGEKAIADAGNLLDEKQKELESGKAAYESGVAKLEEGKAGIEKLENGISEAKAGLLELEAKIPEAETALVKAKEQYETAKTRYEEALAAWESGTGEMTEEQLNALKQAMQEIEKIYRALDAKVVELRKTKEQIEASLPQMQAELVKAEQAVAQGEQELSEAKKKLDAGEAEIQKARGELNEKKSQLKEAKKTIQNSETELASGWKQYEAGKEEAKKQIIRGEQELADAEIEAAEGKKKLEDAKEELRTGEEKIADGEQELADARQDIQDIDMPKWYVYDRDVFEQYTGYGDNADRMRAIGEVFPVLFFLVAALISLTTMTRMVEEQRVQIGTLKALGYSKFSIAGKYLGYAFVATLGGSIVGVLAGEKLYPYIIVNAYKIMYPHLPNVVIPYNMTYAVMATGAAIFCTMAATIISCYKELAAQPAVLMRPPAPKQGKRVFLERITFIWKHLSFIWKSTIRNLIRYKKRFFMTVFGIGGCMALILVGYGLRDSIYNIAVIQYEDIQKYNIMAILDENASDEEKESLNTYIEGETKIADELDIYMKNLTIGTEDQEEEAYIFIPEEEVKFPDFVVLNDRRTKEKYELPQEGAVLTEKMAKTLGVESGDTIYIEDENAGKKEIQITAVCENYMGHYLYLTKGAYETLFGKMPEYNTKIFRMSEYSEKEAMRIGEEMLATKAAINVQYMDNMRGRIEDMLTTLDSVIVVLIAAAGMLAFVVLYNLNNINITERRRELATIKVLGFYDKEVAAYVYRENVLLTIIGAIAGCGLGYLLHRFVIVTVEVDDVMFGRNIELKSYIIAMLFTIGFSAFVNWVMYFKLKKIDMVESLKSVE